MKDWAFPAHNDNVSGRASQDSHPSQRMEGKYSIIALRDRQARSAELIEREWGRWEGVKLHFAPHET